MSLKATWSFFVLALLIGAFNPSFSAVALANQGYINLARVLVRNNRFENNEALEVLFSKSFGLDHNNFSALTGLFISYLLQGEVAAAKNSFQLLSEQHIGMPRDFLPLIVIKTAVDFAKNGSVETAIAVADLLQDSADPERAITVLGQIYQAAGDLEKSEALYRQLIRSSPEQSAAGYIALGQLYFEQRRFPEAKQAYETAFRIDSSADYQAYWGLGLIGMYEGAEVAEKWFLRAAEVAPPGHQRFMAYLYLGHLFGSWCGDQCRYEFAASYFELALDQPDIRDDLFQQARHGLRLAREKLATTNER